MSYKTIKAEPANATFLDTYAWILFVQGRFEDAKIYIDETLKNEIIEYALRRIGSTRIGLLDGTTLIYQDRWYDITVDNGNVTVDEV